MKETDDGFMFNDGSKLSVHRGIVGIVKGDDGIRIYGGYDSSIISEHHLYDIYGDGCEEWGCEADIGTENTRELAAYMIELWTELYNETL